MLRTVPDILSRIVEHKRSELAMRAGRREEWERAAEKAIRVRRDFRAALTAKPPAVIAEMKKASPSAGVLSQDFEPAKIAAAYEKGGAAALSVLTDEKFFQGSAADLEAARGAAQVPVLRKDFTIDEIDVVEAAAMGADAILLIAAILSAEEMRGFRELGARYRMAALVEVHDEEELRRAADSGAEILGVNNRNLHTFEVTLDTSLRLAEKAPAGAVRVAESGIHGAGDVRNLAAAGYQAFLVGEHLMKAPDAAAAIRALRGE
jgi:indole-3-glycerol phosphate synthase